mmetsp:Transcript_67900/g.147880  ORF Transcript_67900/g.147880 Transcript_67900/m.147880 type:complete len:303 (+) Transcript_67900:2264-3172(+)
MVGLVFNKKTGREAGKVWTARNTKIDEKGVRCLTESSPRVLSAFLAVHMIFAGILPADGHLSLVSSQIRMGSSLPRLVRCMQITCNSAAQPVELETTPLGLLLGGYDDADSAEELESGEPHGSDGDQDEEQELPMRHPRHLPAPIEEADVDGHEAFECEAEVFEDGEDAAEPLEVGLISIEKLLTEPSMDWLEFHEQSLPGDHATPAEYLFGRPKGCRIQLHKPWRSWQFTFPGRPSRSFPWGRPGFPDEQDESYTQGLDWLWERKHEESVASGCDLTIQQLRSIANNRLAALKRKASVLSE